MTIPLKYPVGEFTQSELAAFNGMEKLAVYLPMKEAIGKGILIKTGERPTGKRPANVYKVDGNNAPVPVPASQTPQSIVEQPSVPMAPLIPPVVNITPSLEPQKELAAPNPAYPCPICNKPMTEIPDATGVTVKCLSGKDCPSTEEPYGHNKTAQGAWEIAKQKFHL